MAVPQKVMDRFTKEVKHFQDILKNAKDRDVNEADTVVIITDMLASIFGYDKYAEITREFAIRGTYCDLAVKENGAVKYLIEVKAIGLDLKESYVKQAVDYGANKGVKYVILTNGMLWNVYGIKYDRPIQTELVFSLDFLTLNPRSNDAQEALYLLCKEAISRAAIETYHERQKTINRFTISALVLSAPTIDVIRREIKRIAPGVKVDNLEIENILKNEVLKREVLDGEAAKEAGARVKKALSKAAKQKEVPSAQIETAAKLTTQEAL